MASFLSLPSHFNCYLLPQHQTRAEAARVWRRLGSPHNFRADVACCSVDKIKSVMEYAELVLSFKLRTMEQQLEFAEEVENGLRRSKSGSFCQPLMHARFDSRLDALKKVLLMGRRGLRFTRTTIDITLRPRVNPL